ncbi:hypothetical protein [Polyangium sp. y55x31]|uniref:Nmad2 family putative nucleotide modification protein n=1 Tax=Polyangium sp. y55x31 TaxID=3042688 RepID=UPI0024825B55|nr:hypothetical protein [Polyangium sp. y55x31]MDI1484715.1 hypothetical protein [Polyangium sp. y55x31]
MPDLYSYCIPYDDGAAPNPYWGVCTLVICKPAIRRSARVGDWIVGTGSKHARLGNGTTQDMSGRVVYAMKVTEKMTMAEYDSFTRTKLRQKVPAWSSQDRRRRVGDSIYDYSTNLPTQRRGVHKPANAETDRRGKYALLSTHFYYFGDKAIPLKSTLRDVAQNRQGHRRKLNEPYVESFIKWIEGRGYEPGTLVGKPLCDLFASKSACGWCAAGRAEDDEADVEDLAGRC